MLTKCKHQVILYSTRCKNIDIEQTIQGQYTVSLKQGDGRGAGATNTFPTQHNAKEPDILTAIQDFHTVKEFHNTMKVYGGR